MTDGIIHEVFKKYKVSFYYYGLNEELSDLVSLEQELIEKIKQDITVDYIQKERAWKIIEKLIGDNQE